MGGRRFHRSSDAERYEYQTLASEPGFDARATWAGFGACAPSSSVSLAVDAHWADRG